MKRLIAIVGATIGGSIGWWAGSSIGIMPAFLLSVVGTGAGVYAAIQVHRRYLP